MDPKRYNEIRTKARANIEQKPVTESAREREVLIFETVDELMAASKKDE